MNERWGRRQLKNFEDNEKTFWEEMEKMRKVSSVKQVSMKDEDERILTDKNEVCERWK